MSTRKTAAGFTSGNEVRFTIPKVLHEAFAQEPRVLIKWRPDGIWPIDPGLLRRTDLLDRLIEDREFNENFEIVIMRKG